MMFRGQGVHTFREALDVAVRDPAALQRWYLSVINTMASATRVETVSIEGLWWAEIDTPEDLAVARSHFIPFSEVKSPGIGPRPGPRKTAPLASATAPGREA
jgi:choline kinase